MKHRFESEVVRFVIANSLKLVRSFSNERSSFKYANYIIRYRILTTFNLFDGEFDPGSERTLAAWIRHASRAGF